MKIFNKEEKSNRYYINKIEDLEEELRQSQESVEYWRECHDRDYRRIQDLKDQIQTFKSVMENLAPHQLPTVELDIDYYKLIKYSKKAKAFHFLEDLPLEHGDYIILKPKQDSSESSCLARITGKKKIRLSGIYSVSEELGFCNGHMAERDIKLTYPDIDKNTPIYLYYVKILS